MATIDTVNEIAKSFSPGKRVEVSNWFGKPCLKAQNKVFLVLWGKDMAFKLTGDAHAKALAMPGARLFDPRGAGSPMKDWVHVDVPDAGLRLEMARLAMIFALAQV